ncbi:hypothetical protein BGZ98_001988 [Dissophora globulifera]|nr:hypothetical protein BGZ98_001988 [Dissophora globulifera]
MTFLSTLAVVAFGATVISTGADAALSAGCNTYLTNLGLATNPLAKCRVYTTLGFPGITHANDHDTDKLQQALTAYCATPACTADQYASVYKDLQTNCAADMVADNQATLGTTVYMWYMSAAQRDAVCLQDAAKKSFCVIDSINEMIARSQFPNDNKNEDDLYGYLQYVTPMLSAKSSNATSFCTACNEQVANIFSNYYKKTPSPISLNFAQNLTSAALNTDLQYQYQSSCKVTLGTDPATFKPTNVTDPASTTKDGKGSSAQALKVSVAGVATIAMAIAGAIAL